MSIEKNYKEYFIACDDCGATDGGFETFGDAEDAIKELGWQTKKVEGVWENYCEKCRHIIL